MPVEAVWTIDEIVHRTTGADLMATADNADVTTVFGVSKQTANGRAFLDGARKGMRFKATLELLTAGDR